VVQVLDVHHAVEVVHHVAEDVLLVEVEVHGKNLHLAMASI
jgi:hypothetical protein